MVNSALLKCLSTSTLFVTHFSNNNTDGCSSRSSTNQNVKWRQRGSFTSASFWPLIVQRRQTAFCYSSQRVQQPDGVFPQQIINPERLQRRYFTEPTLDVKFPATLIVMTRAWSMPTYHGYIAAAPRCMQDLCWIPKARAYTIGIYIDEKQFDMTLEREASHYLRELKEQQEKESNKSNETVNGSQHALSDEQLHELSERISYILFEPEISKTFCFIFVNQGDVHHITGGFTRVFYSTIKNIKSHEFDFSNCEKTIQFFASFLKRMEIDCGSTLLVTCNPSQPPLASLVFSPDRDSPLEYVGGLSGNSMNMLLHKLYLRDPFDRQQQAHYPSIASRLKNETEQRVLGLLRERMSMNAKSDTELLPSCK